MEWCDRESISGLDRSDFLYLIRALDRAYLEHVAEQHENSLKANKKPVGGKIGGS